MVVAEDGRSNRWCNIEYYFHPSLFAISPTSTKAAAAAAGQTTYSINTIMTTKDLERLKKCPSPDWLAGSNLKTRRRYSCCVVVTRGMLCVVVSSNWLDGERAYYITWMKLKVAVVYGGFGSEKYYGDCFPFLRRIIRPRGVVKSRAKIELRAMFDGKVLRNGSFLRNKCIWSKTL